MDYGSNQRLWQAVGSNDLLEIDAAIKEGADVNHKYDVCCVAIVVIAPFKIDLYSVS
jgi:hypothetical protein